MPRQGNLGWEEWPHPGREIITRRHLGFPGGCPMRRVSRRLRRGGKAVDCTGERWARFSERSKSTPLWSHCCWRIPGPVAVWLGFAVVHAPPSCSGSNLPASQRPGAASMFIGWVGALAALAVGQLPAPPCVDCARGSRSLGGSASLCCQCLAIVERSRRAYGWVYARVCHVSRARRRSDQARHVDWEGRVPGSRAHRAQEELEKSLTRLTCAAKPRRIGLRR